MDCGFWGHTFYSVKEGTFYFSPDMCCLRRKACFFFWSPHRRPKALSSGLTVEMSLQEHRLCCLSAGRGWGWVLLLSGSVSGSSGAEAAQG